MPSASGTFQRTPMSRPDKLHRRRPEGKVKPTAEKATTEFERFKETYDADPESAATRTAWPAGPVLVSRIAPLE